MRWGLLLLTLVACSAHENGTTEPPEWSLLAEGEAASLLAVWGASEDDVWVVGGRPATGAGPTVLRFQSGAWSRIETGSTNLDLWWVFGFEDGPVFFGGSGGTILHYEEGGSFEELETPARGVVFGIWGAAPDDVWAVGGQLGGGGAFVWRYDGERWVEGPELPEPVRSEGTVFKVAGRAADDVWMACSSGVILHWNGSALESHTVGTTATLFAIGIGDERIVAAGGNFTGSIFENDGGGWTAAEELLDGPVWRGVWAATDTIYTVGEVGAVIRRGPAGWEPDSHRLTVEDLHAVWIDPAGGVWVVGGKFDQPMTRDGVLLYKGGQLPEVNGS